jgi:hypothetical protein
VAALETRVEVLDDLRDGHLIHRWSKLSFGTGDIRGQSQEGIALTGDQRFDVLYAQIRLRLDVGSHSVGASVDTNDVTHESLSDSSLS